MSEPEHQKPASTFWSDRPTRAAWAFSWIAIIIAFVLSIFAIKETAEEAEERAHQNGIMIGALVTGLEATCRALQDGRDAERELVEGLTEALPPEVQDRIREIEDKTISAERKCDEILGALTDVRELIVKASIINTEE